MSDDMDLTRSAVNFLENSFAGNIDELLTSAGLSLPLKGSEIPPWVSVANLQPDLVPVDILSRHWIPYTYDGRKDEIRWCLPQGRAVQPFYDEYISHCCQYFVNALLSPRSSLDSLLQYARRFAQLRLRLTRHSKSPHLTFQADSAEKRSSLPPKYVDCIQSSLSELHKALIRKAHK